MNAKSEDKDTDKKSNLKRLTGAIDANRVLAIIAILSLVLNFYQVQLAEISHREDFEAVQSSLKLQQLQSNFTSLVFGYSDGPLASDFKGTTTVNYDAKVGFNVVVIGPHYGYATINQTYFKPYDLSDYHFLNPKCLPAASVLSEGGYILSVAPGAFERNLELHFWMTICPYSDFKSGEGFATHIGVVGVTITFYDVQTKVTTSRLVEIPVAVTYVA